MRTYIVHLANGDILTNLSRAAAVEALVAHPWAKLEPPDLDLETTQEVCDMQRDVVDIRRAAASNPS